MSLKATQNFTMPAGSGSTNSYTVGQILSTADEAIIRQYPAFLALDVIYVDPAGGTATPSTQAANVFQPSTALTTAGTASATSVAVATTSKYVELVIKTTAVTATPTLTITVQVPDGAGGWANAQTLTTSPTAAAEVGFDLGADGATAIDITGQLRFVFTCSGSGAGITFTADVNQ